VLGVSLFKHFDDKRADMTDDLTEESIADFVNRESVALLSEFSQEVSKPLYSLLLSTTCQSPVHRFTCQLVTSHLSTSYQSTG